MSVPEFEDLITQGMIEEKFRQLVTDGITVTPAEIQQEFRRRNEKVKLDYVVIKPDDLQAKIMPSDADLTAYFEKNRARYAVPERRIVRYALLDLDQLRARADGLRRRGSHVLQRSSGHVQDCRIARTSPTSCSRRWARPTRKSRRFARRPRTF